MSGLMQLTAVHLAFKLSASSWLHTLAECALTAGVIDDSIYDPNCTFADPTVKFSGM